MEYGIPGVAGIVCTAGALSTRRLRLLRMQMTTMRVRMRIPPTTPPTVPPTIAGMLGFDPVSVPYA